ncbi:hypothetical protein [Acetobacterium wieringae]|uniref:hypothetical protein n=1 Tax=Acetobacterium wieringae TaxID=52694 RepID=UPI0031589029
MDKTSLNLLKQFNKVGLLTEYDINEFTGYDGHCQNGPQFKRLISDKYICPKTVAGQPGDTPVTLGYVITLSGKEFLSENRSKHIHQWAVTISSVVTALSTLGALIYYLSQ